MTTLTRIRKRDGQIVPFDQDKIAIAIFKAAKAVGGSDFQRALFLSEQVASILEKKFQDKIPSVEEIQDIVEKVLIENGHAKTAKAYILYRKQRSEIREFQSLMVNTGRMVEEYLSRSDWKVNENSNMNYSLQGLNNHMISEITKKYWMEKIYPPEIRAAHESGDMHIHDLFLLLIAVVGFDDPLLTGLERLKSYFCSTKHFAPPGTAYQLYTPRRSCRSAGCIHFDSSSLL